MLSFGWDIFPKKINISKIKISLYIKQGPVCNRISKEENYYIRSIVRLGPHCDNYKK